MILFSKTVCYATIGQESTNIQFNVTENQIIDIKDKTVTIVISLGDFVGTQDNCVLGYEAILEYDKTVFQSIEIVGLNGWSCDYEDSTKILLGDVNAAKANTNIAKIIFTLNDEVEETTSVVHFNNIELTDGTNDFRYNKKANVTIKRQEIQETPIGQENDKKINIITGEKEDKKADETISKKNIPQTGGNNVIMILIGIMLVMAIIGLIGYKKIRLK